MVTQDVVPYGMVHGDRARVNGLNIIGLRRLGVKPDDLKSIKEMYRLVFDANLTVEDAVKKIEDTLPDSTYRTEWIEFLRRGERGLCR